VIIIPQKNLPIGLFDSGVGGVSVLGEAVCELPLEAFLYYGDSAHAPYGVRSASEVKELSLRAAEVLIDKGIKTLVVACNTATSVAVNDLREQLDIPVIGMEPALKPAVEMGKGGKIVVMATPLTLREEKFQRLLGQYQDQRDIIPLSCPGLVELIEQGCYQGPDMDSFLKRLFIPLAQEDISVIVLGCTHYVFIKTEIENLKPDAKVIDGNGGTVKQLTRVLRERGLLSDRPPEESRIKFLSSSSPERFLPVCMRLLEFCANSKDVFETKQS